MQIHFYRRVGAEVRKQLNAFVKILFRAEQRNTSLLSKDFSVSKVMKSRKIPDRWENYTALGSVVEGTRFIAFKVPLKKTLSLPKDIESFTPQDLSTILKEKGLELGLVIDLTNTTRYYNKEEIMTQGIAYQKIFTEGHLVPSKSVQNRFFKVVDDFLISNGNNELLIGVHCTHGLNRTGYLICRYMIDRMNFKADDAIKAFNEARGYDIERENYLNDLRKHQSCEPKDGEQEPKDGEQREQSTEESTIDILPQTDGKPRVTDQRIQTVWSSFPCRSVHQQSRNYSSQYYPYSRQQNTYRMTNDQTSSHRNYSNFYGQDFRNFEESRHCSYGSSGHSEWGTTGPTMEFGYCDRNYERHFGGEACYQDYQKESYPDSYKFTSDEVWKPSNGLDVSHGNQFHLPQEAGWDMSLPDSDYGQCNSWNDQPHSYCGWKWGSRRNKQK